MIIQVLVFRAVTYLADFGQLGLPTADPTISSSNLSINASTRVTAFSNHIVNILLSVTLPLAILGIAYTSYKLIISNGNPEAMKTARKNISYLVIGIFVIAFAFVGLGLVYRAITSAR